MVTERVQGRAPWLLRGYREGRHGYDHKQELKKLIKMNIYLTDRVLLLFSNEFANLI